MLGEFGRGLQAAVFTPPARFLARHNVSPDAVTITGTLVTMALALTLLPLGKVALGGVLLGLVLVMDSLDGTVARVSGKESQWGAFLDSTLDRVADGAVFVGLSLWAYFQLTGSLQTVGICAGMGALILGAAVPYARAKAEAINLSVKRGFLERTDRLIIGLVSVGVTELGLPTWVGVAGLVVVAVGAGLTVVQRIVLVRRAYNSAQQNKVG